MVNLVEWELFFYTCCASGRWFGSYYCCFRLASRDDTFDRSAFYVHFKNFRKPQTDMDLHFVLWFLIRVYGKGYGLGFRFRVLNHMARMICCKM